MDKRKKQILALQVIALTALIAGLSLTPLRSALPATAEPQARTAQNRPNILFIFADDLGWGDLGCHGNQLVRTPNIDRLAAEGTDFQQFYVANPVCSPSRTAVMTGHYPARYSIHEAIGPLTKNAEGGSADWLDPRAPTLPRQLKAAGYVTGHFGKWHLSGEAVRDAPSPDVYGVDEHGVWTGGGGAKEITHRQVFDVAIDFMRRHKEQPFFLNVWLHESHLAHTPSEESMKEFAHLDERQRVYSAAVADADKGVGKLLAALKQFGLESNTLVIFSSDNGPERSGPAKTLRDGYGNYYAIGSTGGLRGRKRSLFDGGVRTPFIVRWPGRVPTKKVNDTSVLAAVDLLPTLCAIAGAKLPENYQGDGENVLAALEGKAWRRTKPLFWEWRGIEQPETWPRLAVRDGDWKLLMTFDQSRVELYNLARDRAEAQNVAKDHPKIVEQLTAKLLAWKATLPKEPSPDCVSKGRK